MTAQHVVTRSDEILACFYCVVFLCYTDAFRKKRRVSGLVVVLARTYVCFSAARLSVSEARRHATIERALDQRLGRVSTAEHAPTKTTHV